MPIVLFIHADRTEEYVPLTQEDIACGKEPFYVTIREKEHRWHFGFPFGFPESKVRFIGYIFIYPSGDPVVTTSSYSAVCDFDSTNPLKRYGDARLREHSIEPLGGAIFFVSRNISTGVFGLWYPHNDEESKSKVLSSCGDSLALPPVLDAVAGDAREDLARHLRHLESSMS